MNKLALLALLAVPMWGQFTNAKKIQGVPVGATAPTDGQALCFDLPSHSWLPATSCLNAGATGATGKGYLATSTTSLATAGSGSKSFTTQAGLAYTVGARIRATAAASGEYMEGVVTAYSSTTLVATMDLNSGTGTHTDWNINLAGNRGTAGATGATGATGDTGAAGPLGSTFTCTVTAVSSKACTHNLNFSLPWVTCYDASGNMLGGATASTSVTDVVATSANVATITFSGTTTGTCTVSTGGTGAAGATGATGASGAMPDPGSNGFMARSALNTTVARTLTAGNGISISNPTGAAGDPVITNAVPFVVAMTSVQTFAGDTQTPVQWTVNQGGTSSLHSTSVNPSRFLAPTTGLYQGVCFISFTSALSAGNWSTAIRLNGTTYISQAYFQAGATASSGQIASVMYYLTAGDYVECLVSPPGSTTINDVGTTVNSNMSWRGPL